MEASKEWVFHTNKGEINESIQETRNRNVYNAWNRYSKCSWHLWRCDALSKNARGLWCYYRLCISNLQNSLLYS